MSFDEPVNFGKISASKVTAIIGALAAFMAAAMPGVIAMVDKTGDIAQEKAQKSEEKTVLAYELLRSRLDNIQIQLNDLKDRDIAQNNLLSQMLLERAAQLKSETSQQRRRRERARAARSTLSSTRGFAGSGGGGGAPANSALDVSLDEPEKAAGKLQQQIQEQAQEPDYLQQAQLPKDLEREWVKSKSKK